MLRVKEQLKTSTQYEKTIHYVYDKIKLEILKQKATKFEKRRWLILNKKYEKAFLSKNRVQLFKTCTGSGKSVTSVLWAKYMSIYAKKDIDGFVVLSPEYENGTDEIERIIENHGRKVDYIRFEGKSRLCLERETKINKRGVKIKDLLNSGISINGYCENECSNYGSCKYYENCKAIIESKEKGGIKNWIGVQHQIGAILPIYLLHTEDIILIIDEDFTDAIKNHYKYKVPQLRKNRRFLELLMTEFDENNVSIDDPFRYFVNLFIDVIDVFLADLYTFLQPLQYERLTDLFDDIDTVKGIDDYLLHKLEGKAYEYIVDGKISPFKFIYKEICNYIDNYMLEDPLDNPNINGWIQSSFIKVQNKFQISFLYYDKFLLNRIFERDNVKKVIINDATSDKEIISFLLRNVEKIEERNENWMYDNCEFHQLKKLRNHESRDYAHYPKTSFFYKNTFFFLMEDVKSIFKKHRRDKVLVVARDIESEKIKFAKMKLSTYISTLGHADFEFEDYPLSGTNVYSDYDVVILLGKPELPRAVLQRQSTLIGMNKEEYRKLYSKNLMIQGMGRIFRGSGHKYVYILTGFDLELNKSITTYKSHTELQNIMNTIAKKREERREKENKTNIIFQHFEKSKFITIKVCEKLLNISNYKANKFLSLLCEKGVLTKQFGERGIKLYSLKK